MILLDHILSGLGQVHGTMLDEQHFQRSVVHPSQIQ